jgi:phosphatidylglycerophosphatase A
MFWREFQEFEPMDFPTRNWQRPWADPSMRQAGRNIILFLASGCGFGYLPYCPGTFGTVVAVPLSLVVNRIAVTNPWLSALVLSALMSIAIWLAGQAARLLGKKDPQVIVIDEIAGFVLANFRTGSWTGLIIAFGLFRFFDIAKIFPAGRLETLQGGRGIVLDDMCAGLYTFLILRLLSSAGLI